MREIRSIEILIDLFRYAKLFLEIAENIFDIIVKISVKLLRLNTGMPRIIVYFCFEYCGN